MKAKTKIGLELFARRVLVYSIILLFIFGYAFLIGKEKETLFLMISYTITRNMFDKQFHCSSSIKCLKTTIIVFALSITAILKYELSILECLLIGVVINYIGFIVMLLPIEEVKLKNKRQKILSVVKNDEEAIEALCKSLGLIDLSETVYLYLNNTIEEVASILEIDTSTVTRRINKFIKTTKCI